MKKKSDKWSIQISKNLYENLKSHCKERGYKISGFVEKSIKHTISGSVLV
jgi:hypothetical protein